MISITIDIEDWYHIPSVCGSPFSVYENVDEFYRKWTGRYDYLTKPTHNVLELLNQFDVQATFFVVANVIDRYPGLVESIAEQGHEIACHGLTHACKIDPTTKQPLMSLDVFERNTQVAKRLLEKESGEAILGYRAPNALVAGWMIDSLKRLNFSYDSSVCVNSFYNKSDSTLQNVSSYPYNPQTGGLEPGGPGSFIEFPWAYWDLLGKKIPTSGGPMLRFLGSHIILKGLQQSLTRGNTIFYFHPLDIAREKFPNVGKNRPFYWAIKGKVVEKRIMHIIQALKSTDIEIKPIRDLLG